MKKAFTLVELLGVIIILGVLALITFPIIDKSIKNSKEKALERTIDNIEEAAYNYSMKNDLGYETFYKKLSLEELKTSGFLEKEIINPITNNEMFGCVIYKWDESKKQYEFKYDEECDVTAKPIYDAVIEQFPYLETKGNGCVTSTDSNYSYMDGCYIKGNSNNNYIWYSGFLWRIMGINADQSVRLINDENVTSIPYHENSSNWDNSYIKNWLNKYFYPRLKGNNIIKEMTWCSETTTDRSSAKTECTANLSKSPAYVGLMTLDEYNLAGGSSSYLNIGQEQWTMTSQRSSFVWYLDIGGIAYVSGDYENGVNMLNGVRSVINVDKNAAITGGNGTIGVTWSSEVGPYILNDDKKTETKGKLNEQATSGEYVLFAGKKYRVVDKDSSGNTKLVLDGYYEEEGSIFKMNYGSNSTFSKDTGIGQKLNTDVLNWLTNNNESEKNKLVSNYTWYQNNFKTGDSYEVSLDETSTPIYATVGLIRVGEMLSNQSSSILTKGYTKTSSYLNATVYWTMTPYSSSSTWFMNSYGNMSNVTVSQAYGLQPIIVIKSDVTITGGNGTWSNPYQI